MSVVAFAPAVLEPTALHTDLDAAGARALVLEVRQDLAAVVDGLARAFSGRAWLALGHDSWKTFCEVELGDALQGLSKAMRQDVVGALSDTGFSARAMAPLLGVKSDQTIRVILEKARPNGVVGARLGADGKTYQRARTLAAVPAMLALPAPQKQLTAREVITAAGEHGVTVPELMKKQRWTWSQASACASRLNRAVDAAGQRTIERLAERRDGHAIYVDPTATADRVVLEPGQRLPRSA